MPRRQMARGSMALSAVLVLGACAAEPTIGEHGGSESSTGDGDGELEPLRGDLELIRVELSQALLQPLFADGELVDANAYAVPVVPRRPTLVRAQWVTPPDWTPRPVLARLHLQGAQGEWTLDEIRTVATDSDPSALSTSFVWSLEPAWVEPGLRWQIELAEAEPGEWMERPAPSVAPRWPSEGPATIAVEAEPATMRVVLVGVDYQTPECSTNTGALTSADLDAIRERFEAWNAVESVQVDTGIVVGIDTAIASVDELLPTISQIRAEYAESFPDAFFVLMLAPCTEFAVLGVAPVNPLPPQIDDAFTRFAAVLWYPEQLERSLTTLVHEVGHSQGALHAPCGIDDEPDPDFPHAEGTIGLEGLDPVTLELHPADSHRDFMGYCEPFWVSDHRFRRSYEHQRVLSSWAD